MNFTHIYAEQLAELSSAVRPQKMRGSKLAIVNAPLAEQLQVAPFLQDENAFFNALYSEQGMLAGKAVAQKYGGHQFGHWNPDLGDGRGLLLAEVTDRAGNKHDLHLKGAGKTPYSRFGDGRAVLRSTLREYLASEALHHMGIPSSRALCLIETDEPVQREEIEPGAMLIRTAPSHIRFGHFEYYFHTQQADKLQQLFDFVLQHHYPEYNASTQPYFELLRRIITDTAKLIARWQAYGFCHGVMNTDNMSIHGITFDYGPYGFLDKFQPDFVCNHSDSAGRYAFDQQPGVALWNLNALAYAFTDKLDEQQLRQLLAEYEPTLLREYSELMAARFGFQHMQSAQQQLVNEYMQQMETEGKDFNLSFRLLNGIAVASENSEFLTYFADTSWSGQWLQRYCEVLADQQEEDSERQNRMNKVNPVYILRNYLAQNAIEKAQKGDFSYAERLLKALQNPFQECADFAEFAAAPPESAQCVALSCSS